MYARPDNQPRNQITAAVDDLRAGRSSPERRDSWTERLPALAAHANDDPHAGEHFIRLSTHLAEHATTPDRQEALIRALSEATEYLDWNSQLLPDLDGILADTIERLFTALAAELEHGPGPEETLAIYTRLRDYCWGHDERIIDLFADSPHVTGRRITIDFTDTVGVSAPVAILRMLEDEGETGLLLGILEHEAVRPHSVLSSLRAPDRLVDRALETYLETRLATGLPLPAWVWREDVLLVRFDLIRTRIPWHETATNADPALRARIDIHLRAELGTDPEHRETFHALADGFPGTLDELVNAARNL